LISRLNFLNYYFIFNIMIIYLFFIIGGERIVPAKGDWTIILADIKRLLHVQEFANGRNKCQLGCAY
jgi:hypothetical protein